ncbi:MAG: hypothetical protein EOO48_09705 [Flavobacterium sp.]|nr:MAG: hypothetical protein EOO48_09705 [Flavobacterium sp.]
MKTLITGFAIAAFALSAQAQNKNVTDISKTTVTTVKDSEGEKKVVKNEKTQEVQNIEFQNADSNQLNKDMKASPVQVTSTTTITGPDGKSRTVDVDRSAYYSIGGSRYQVKPDNTGYTMTDATGKRAGVLRQMGNNTYIYRANNNTSYASFDANGNLVIQTYDDKNDTFTTTTYSRN